MQTTPAPLHSSITVPVSTKLTTHDVTVLYEEDKTVGRRNFKNENIFCFILSSVEEVGLPVCVSSDEPSFCDSQSFNL